MADALAVAATRKQSIEADVIALQSIGIGESVSITIGKSAPISVPAPLATTIITGLIEAKTAEVRALALAIDTIERYFERFQEPGVTS